MAHPDTQDPLIGAIVIAVHLAGRRADLLDADVLDADALIATTLKRDEVLAVLRVGLKSMTPESAHAQLFLDQYDDEGKPIP